MATVKKITGNDAITPMMRQYLEIKEQCGDAILFFRLGDFYEMFFDDAVIASKILDITLTSRNKNNNNPVPLCGVPYHSVEPYIVKLLENSKKVAICEQVEDPKSAKGVVRREITKIYTPGVVPDGNALDASSNNFVAAVYFDGKSWGLAHADISTGLFKVTEFSGLDQVISELARIEPREVLIPEQDNFPDDFHNKLNPEKRANLITYLSDKLFSSEQIESLHGNSEIAGKEAAKKASGAVYSYLSHNLRAVPQNIIRLEFYESDDSMKLDDQTKKNLELLRTINSSEVYGSLFWLLNNTQSAMGARLLKQWICYPSTSCKTIEKRLECVASLVEERPLSEAVHKYLKNISDIERLSTRVVMGTANSRDVRALALSFQNLVGLKELLAKQEGLLGEIGRQIDPVQDLMNEAASTIVDEPPISVREGGMIKEGINSELDDLRRIQLDAKKSMAAMESSERSKTGINSLKIRYNKVFGYYLEVTNTHKEKVPQNYIRKQTLANAERYITEELKVFEEKVLGANDRIKALEYEIFSELRSRVATENQRIVKTAKAVANLDVLLSLALAAHKNNYVRPEITDDEVIDIEEGRHPVVEKLQTKERFVPNDIKLDRKEGFLLIITGPNMAGKSTVMRQTALIVLMAQIGSFVPAKKAHIGIVDRIFTRIGASDALAKGLSTFMVEMTEAATILNEATQKSLIIVDEIGRGTSTFDGLAIAWAIAEDLHDRVKARTLFATHYHELTELSVTRKGVKNFQIAVKEWNDQIIFLRRLVPGGTSHSYGIQVASLAGLSKVVIERAHQILANMEKSEFDEIGRPRIATTVPIEKTHNAQMTLFTAHPLLESLRETDLSTLTPLEALNLLHQWKKTI